LFHWPSMPQPVTSEGLVWLKSQSDHAALHHVAAPHGRGMILRCQSALADVRCRHAGVGVQSGDVALLIRTQSAASRTDWLCTACLCFCGAPYRSDLNAFDYAQVIPPLNTGPDVGRARYFQHRGRAGSNGPGCGQPCRARAIAQEREVEHSSQSPGEGAAPAVAGPIRCCGGRTQVDCFRQQYLALAIDLRHMCDGWLANANARAGLSRPWTAD
jgi:hypothetical protein